MSPHSHRSVRLVSAEDDRRDMNHLCTTGTRASAGARRTRATATADNSSKLCTRPTQPGPSTERFWLWKASREAQTISHDRRQFARIHIPAIPSDSIGTARKPMSLQPIGNVYAPATQPARPSTPDPMALELAHMSRILLDVTLCHGSASNTPCNSEPGTPTTPPAAKMADDETEVLIHESSSKHRRGQHGQVIGLNADNEPAASRESARRSPAPPGGSSILLADARVAALRSLHAGLENELPEAHVVQRSSVPSTPVPSTSSTPNRSSPRSPGSSPRRPRARASPLTSRGVSAMDVS